MVARTCEGRESSSHGNQEGGGRNAFTSWFSPFSSFIPLKPSLLRGANYIQGRASPFNLPSLETLSQMHSAL
jgi:hypothetical protein